MKLSHLFIVAFMLFAVSFSGGIFQLGPAPALALYGQGIGGGNSGGGRGGGQGQCSQLDASYSGDVSKTSDPCHDTKKPEENPICPQYRCADCRNPEDNPLCSNKYKARMPKVTCEVRVGNNVSDLTGIITSAAAPKDTAGAPIFKASRFPEFYDARVLCGAEWTDSFRDPQGQAKIEGSFDLNLSSCSSVGATYDGFCIEDSVLKNDRRALEIPYSRPLQLALVKDGGGNDVRLLLRKKGLASMALAPVAFSFENKTSGTAGQNVAYDPAEMTRTVTAPAMTDNAACRVIASGAINSAAANTPNALVDVSNGTLEFRAVIDNASGEAARIRDVVWGGGPDQAGRWTSAPSNAVATVTATVTRYAGPPLTCSVRIRPQGRGYQVKIHKYGDCGYFTALRNYYLTVPIEGTPNMTARRTGFGKGGLGYPGIDADYGVETPEVPFRGIMNGAADLTGRLVIGLNGVVTLPPIDKRYFSKAVIVAKSFDNTTKKIGTDPVFYGVIDYDNYQKTELLPVPGAPTPSPESTLVFQIYLAATQREGNSDIRGQPKGLPYWDFVPSSKGTRDPFDRIVPLMNDSCIPMFQISPPAYVGRKLPQELKSVVSCTYSRPFTFGDFTAGRVGITAVHLVPEHPFHQFPTELIKASTQPVCVAQNTNDTVSCWNIKASQLGQSTSQDPFESHDQCRTVKVVDKPSTYCNGYGCYTILVPTTVVEYSASCNVIETKNECEKNLAIRFSGYSQMSGASLGCAVKYNRPGEVVTATLANAGIIPYQVDGATPASVSTTYNSQACVAARTSTVRAGRLLLPYCQVNGGSACCKPEPAPASTVTSFGGANPAHYKNYAPGRVSQDPAGGGNMGYACIPCRFASLESAEGRDIYEDTRPLPLDQDASTPRKPMFSFNKGTGPRECVRNVEIEVRYFGSGACNGVAAPPGHFCSAENITQRNCPTTDTAGNFSGGGNVAGKFTVPVCPGSGFEYDSVSVSWSPIIVDVAGNGIQISREHQYSIPFDIKGTGKPSQIDWPTNNKEVAFLVRPNKGKVTSIKELFGDYKAKNGFEALRALDANKDGKIDAKDKQFGELALWHDLNRDGKVQDGEIVSLASEGVESISLEYTKLLDKGIEGKTLSALYFNDKNRRFMNVEDHWFYEYKQDGKKIGKK